MVKPERASHLFTYACLLSPILMAGSSDSSESSNDPATVTAGLLVLALLCWGFVRAVKAVWSAICRCFCPSWVPKPAVQIVKAGDIVMGAEGDLVKDVTVAPRLQKNLTVAYWLWQCLGLVGAHHFYLGRISQGLVWAFSLGMFGFGWLIDGAFLKKYTEWANKVRAGAVTRGWGNGVWGQRGGDTGGRERRREGGECEGGRETCRRNESDLCLRG